MSSKKDCFLECDVRLRLLRGPDVLPYKQRILRIAAAIKDSASSFRETYADEIEEYENIRKLIAKCSMQEMDELEDRLEEISSVWEDDLFEATEHQNALSQIIDNVNSVDEVFVSLEYVDDLIDSGFQLEKHLKAHVDASYILWPQSAFHILTVLEEAKAHLFPSLQPLHQIIRRSAEENHPIQLLDFYPKSV